MSGNNNWDGIGSGREHIVFVTETPRVDEKAAATKSAGWHSGGGIGTRVEKLTTVQTVVETSSDSDSVETMTMTPLTTITRTTSAMMSTEGSTLWFTEDFPTQTSASGLSPSLQPSTASASAIPTPTPTTSSAPNGMSRQTSAILGAALGGLAFVCLLLGVGSGVYIFMKKRDNRADRQPDFHPTAGSGSHSQPYHAHEDNDIGVRPQPTRQPSSQMAPHAVSPDAGPYQGDLSRGPSQAVSPYDIASHAAYYHSFNPPQSPVSPVYHRSSAYHRSPGFPPSSSGYTHTPASPESAGYPMSPISPRPREYQPYRPAQQVIAELHGDSYVPSRRPSCEEPA